MLRGMFFWVNDQTLQNIGQGKNCLRSKTLQFIYEVLYNFVARVSRR